MQLRSIIACVLSDAPRREAVQALFTECQRFALAYLRYKRRSRYLQAQVGLSLEDLALDCFADLFERDESGCFVQLTTYFEDAGWPDLSEEATKIALRRLVFSKVNDGLFRRHREADPQLAKIIRNIKLAAKAAPDAALSRRGRELWLVIPDSAPDLRQAPVIPPELLEARVIACLHDATSMNHILASFVELVEAWPAYCNGYPLSSFARVVSDAFRRFGELSEDDPHREKLFMRMELEEAVESITEKVQAEMYDTYVGRNKVCIATFNAYFDAVRDILYTQFVSGMPDRASYFEALNAHVPDLTAKAYRTRHRHILEYVAKLARGRLVLYFERVLT